MRNHTACCLTLNQTPDRSGSKAWTSDTEFTTANRQILMIDLRWVADGTRGLISNICKQETPIFQLQTTFAALQESSESVFNPVKLVESLKLRTTEQQDAQE